MKRYIRNINDFYGRGIEAEDTATDTELEDKYGDDNVTYEFNSLDEMWRWLNDEDTETN